MNQPARAQGEAIQSEFPKKEHWQKVAYLGERLIALTQTEFVPTNPELSAFPDRGVMLAQSQLVRDTVVELFGGQAALWLPRWLGSDVGYLSQRQRTSKITEQIFSINPPHPLMVQALESKRLCRNKVRRNRLDEPAPGRQTQLAAMAIPLFGRIKSNEDNPIIGVLYVERPEGPAFKPLEQELFTGVASQASIALQTSRQMAVERWRNDQLALVHDVSLQLVEQHNLSELTRRVTRLIRDTFEYYYVAIYTLAPRQETLIYHASARPASSETADVQEEIQFPSIRLGQGMVGMVALTGQEILANNVDQETRYRHSDSLPETRSEFTLPLKTRDRLLGVLDVQSDLLYDFNDLDVTVLRSLAGNIALAIEGTRLFSDLQRRAEQLSAISEVSNAIVSILETDQLLEEVVHLISQHFGFPYVHLFSVHPGRRKVFYEAGSGERSREFTEGFFAYDLDDPHGIIPWVARHGETVLTNDVNQEPRYRPSPFPPENTRSELAVPLKFGSDVLGILDLQSDLVNAFGQEDLFLFEALGDNIAVAMRNANLYRSEKWRRQVADSLREVAGLISAEAGLDQVLGSILTELERNLPCDLAAIWLLDAETSDQDSPPQLRLAATTGDSSAWMESRLGLTLDEIFEPKDEARPDSPSAQPAEQFSWLADGLQGNQPVVRDAYDVEDRFSEALGFPGNYSAIAAPLRAGEDLLGVLTLQHHTSGRYGSEARAMTAAFASYAAVAIENTSLFKSAHEQIWVSTVLLQVAEATQSITDLHELLTTVAHITPMLVGVNACAFYLRDPDGGFSPAAVSGLEEEEQAEFANRRFLPGEVPALDELVEEKRPTILHQEGDDLCMADLFRSASESTHNLEFLILTPLVAHGDLLGALLVDYTVDALKSSMQTLNRFIDEHLPILQGIAHQAATAIENSYLLQSQKEEAYVSVALLQVAQAVVSANDLQDSLGAIVRITPMLVGIKRVAIYQLDDRCTCFQLVQSYGLPREADLFQYTLDEFPLLQAAVEYNTLLAVPVKLNPENNDEWEDVPESWTYLPAPDPEQTQEYLAYDPRLLLAFPLTVKDKILGVMLVEEPDPRPKPGSVSSPNQRMRERRLEITTGISQQVALAIQNEGLQREMLVRDRLEREMQMARQIQQTFLPRQMPELDHYELNLWWRTAREVGGDFYDLISLPDGRLAFVIADVADKGMPAALFMTLIRTLVRAAARDSDSPTEILLRVNDLLVPDAHEGMFVTLFFAVLDQVTGNITYANAGQNPPLWVRKEQKTIETLTRSGMALGVEAGNLVEEREFNLHPGDFLVMYTDGVTDAMSPGEELFGSERLFQTVWNAAFNEPGADSSQDILQYIDNIVSEFTGDSPTFDDTTVLVLMRKID